MNELEARVMVACSTCGASRSVLRKHRRRSERTPCAECRLKSITGPRPKSDERLRLEAKSAAWALCLFVRRLASDRQLLLARTKVGRPDECWLWQGPTSRDGYGKLLGDFAHRVSYRVLSGPIPAGMLVMHSCDNPPCVNPRHLSLGTCKDNTQDMMRKGRWATGERGTVEAYGVALSVRSWAAMAGLAEDRVRLRLNVGWPVELAVSRPPVPHDGMRCELCNAQARTWLLGRPRCHHHQSGTAASARSGPEPKGEDISIAYVVPSLLDASPIPSPPNGSLVGGVGTAGEPPASFPRSARIF